MADSLSVSFRYTKEDILNVVIESLGFDIKRCWLMLFGILLLLCVAGYFVLIKVYMVTILFVLLNASASKVDSNIVIVFNSITG